MKGLGTVGEQNEFMLCGAYSFRREKCKREQWSPSSSHTLCEHSQARLSLHASVSLSGQWVSILACSPLLCSITGYNLPPMEAESGTEAETMEERCLLAFFQAHVPLPFFIAQAYLPRGYPTYRGLDPPTSTSSQATCPY